MHPSAHDFGRALVIECERRLFGESLPRLRKCLDCLSEEEIWSRPNAQCNSVGNLVLHLSGNVRQWIVHSLGGAPDHRIRQQEFDERGPIPKAELFARMEQTLSDARDVLSRLDPASLLEKRAVQGYQESGLSILVHVVEHFSYHVGQISYIVKAGKALDLGYYAGKDLSKTGDST